MNRKKYFLAGLVSGVLLFLFWYFFIGISAGQPGSFYNTGNNALWLEHAWVGEEKTRAEIEELVRKLEDNDIGTVFLHSGPFEADGTIPPETYAFAPYFLEVAREFNAEIQYQAWLGQRRDAINLDDKEVQHNVAKSAMIMSQLVGFDGVHFDVEPVWDGDLGFIDALRESRELMPDDKVISVALAEFIPQSVIWLTEKSHDFKTYNSEVNYLNVAQYADQVVVMVYDTGLHSEWWYRKLVAEQTIWLSRLLEGKQLFVGIPSYEDETRDSDFKVENIENGIIGVIDGLNNVRSEEENFEGVAIYSYWETDESEWETFKQYWLK